MCFLWGLSLLYQKFYNVTQAAALFIQALELDLWTMFRKGFLVKNRHWGMVLVHNFMYTLYRFYFIYLFIF